MNAQELFLKLSKMSEKTRESLPVYIRKNTIVGNIVEVDRVKRDKYGFFGRSLPCLILEED